MVTCIYCKQRFDRDKIPAIEVKNRRYAHKECVKRKEELLTQEEKDKEAFYEYVKKLLGDDYTPAKIAVQVKHYLTDYKFTYSGMLQSLIYFYEIKGNNIEKAKGGIGIIPFIYKDAYNYYYALWLANENNKDKDVSTYVPEVIEVTIPKPKKQIRKRRKFMFLDWEEKDGEK